MGFHPALLERLRQMKYKFPTEVQYRGFSPIMKGLDTVLNSETGSGKTAAYLLPLISQIYYRHDQWEVNKAQGNSENPIRTHRPWVILFPNTDLSNQTLRFLQALDPLKRLSIQSLTRLTEFPRVYEPGIVGAPPSYEEVIFGNRIRFGSVDVVLASLQKFVEDLPRFSSDLIYPGAIVFDECDMLFDGSSRNWIYDIFEVIRPRLSLENPLDDELLPVQLIFSTSTMVTAGPYSVGGMIIQKCCTAEWVVSSQVHKLPASVSTTALPASSDWHERVQQLTSIIDVNVRTLVFVNSVWNCKVLFSFLKDQNWPVARYSMGQYGRMGPRMGDISAFQEGTAKILITTPYGSRGLDWQADEVINFEFPKSVVEYVHRCGRVGRMGRPGRAISLVSNPYERRLMTLITNLGDNKLEKLFSRKQSLNKKIKSGFLDDLLEPPALPAPDNGDLKTLKSNHHETNSH